uniref:Uncharacterized protein n=1 Tax=Oryza punctata TaxID=4537 RepID=A0A0E0LJ94_ORYPU
MPSATSARPGLQCGGVAAVSRKRLEAAHSSALCGGKGNTIRERWQRHWRCKRPRYAKRKEVGSGHVGGGGWWGNAMRRGRRAPVTTLAATGQDDTKMRRRWTFAVGEAARCKEGDAGSDAGAAGRDEVAPLTSLLALFEVRTQIN